MAADARILSAIEDCFSADAKAYAENKRRGGDNGAKGIRYEDMFFASAVVDAVVCMVEGASSGWPFIQAQCTGFVDDTRISDNRTTKYHQLKNQKTLSWTSGKHSLQSDFERQFKLSNHLGEPQPSTRLVVPDLDVKRDLEANMPSSIAAHSSVLHFPWHERPNALVLESAELQKKLKELTRTPAPTKEEMAGAFGVVLLASANYPDGAAVDTILSCANQYFPNLIRAIPLITDGNDHLRVEFKAILDAIDGLSYGAERGYFYFSGGWMSTTLPFDIFDRRFAVLQDNVVIAHPKTILDLEKVMP